ncbi:MAG: DEAD/DEAH box helicase [Candidatus Njordarchaeota archaeon]
MNVFSCLHPKLRRILGRMGIEKPTLAQEKAIPVLLESDTHAIIVAPTGAGKTEAAVLPLISKMLYNEERKPLVLLYITPLRSLNRDIFRRLLKILELLNISADIRHGDTPSSVRRRQSVRPPTVLITTPETLNILLWSPKIRKHFGNTRFIIVDEVHEIADSKRGPQLALVLERIRLLGAKPQIVLISATVANPEDVLAYFTGGEGGKIINAVESKRYVFKVVYVEPKIDNKFGMLIVKPNMRKVIERIYEILVRTEGKALIFTNTRDMAEALGAYLRQRYGANVGVHHSSIARDIRIETEKAIKFGKVNAVIATSSLELGIDIGDIDHVIQVNSPRRVEVALQRVGRSGHFVKRTSKGTLITMTINDFLEALSIVDLSKRKIVEPVNLIYESYDVLAHQIIGIVRDFKFDAGEYPSPRQVFDIVTRAYAYKDLRFDKFISLCRFMTRRSRSIRLENDKIRLTRKSIRQYFDNVSMIPRSPKYRVRDVSRRKIVGELDEQYVIGLGVGKKFILGGQCREVLQIDDVSREILVRTSKEITDPPSWIGELMPVSFFVAQNVGRLRRIFAGGTIGKLGRFVDDEKILGKIVEAMKNVDVIPDDRTILVEYLVVPFEHSMIVIHSCFGDKVNKILGMLLYRLLVEDVNIPVIDYSTDAYKIHIRLYPSITSMNDVRRAIIMAFRRLLEIYKEENVDIFIRETVLRDKYSLLWCFLNVARRFGIIGDESVSRGQILFLMDKYRGTILMEEAINEFVYTKTNIKYLKNVLSRLARGKIEISIRSGLSTFANFEFQIVEVPKSSTERREFILRKYRERLLRRKIKWICLQCGHTEIRRISEPRWESCPKCGSMIISVSKMFDYSEFILQKMRSGEEITPQERKRINLLYSIGMMLREKPEETLLVVAASGTNLQQCLSILRKVYDEYALLELLQDIEARFIKSQLFK